MRTLLILVLSLLASTAEALITAPLNLNYTLTEQNVIGFNPDDAPALNLGVYPSSGFVQDVAINDLNFNITMTTDTNRTQVTSSNIVLTVNDTPYTASGNFDLGFFGQFPYAVTVDAVTISFTGSTRPLSLAGNFSLMLIQGNVTYEGEVTVNGDTSPFSATAFTQIFAGGNLDTTDNSSIVMMIGMTPNLVNTARAFTGSVAGHDVALDVGIDFSPTFTGHSNNTPEPGTVILLGAGLVGLAIVGRKQ